MTLHYHMTPITPKSVLYTLAGKCFGVSFARPENTKIVHRIGQSVMHDNGAFSVWKSTQEPVADWAPYYAWVEPLIANAAHWAIIPDEIDSGSQAQDYLVKQWPFGHRGAPVWHMDEPMDRLLRLADAWPRLCVGATAEYAVVGSDGWHRRIDEMFGELGKRHRFVPWVHMLRGMQATKWGYPFASVDSSDVGQSHHRRRGDLGPLIDAPAEDFTGARRMADRWDGTNCPGRWVRGFEQQDLL